MFSLLSEEWLPVRRADGSACRIKPAQLTTERDTNPIIAIDWPRADFRVAALEFLIGLLATACPPETPRAWFDWWKKPPDEVVLAASLAPLAHAFVLDGDGPRFMQDLEDLPGEPASPESLLIEAPGEAGRRNNTTLLVKPDRVLHLSRAAAAMALFTLQTYAPAGGRGNLTSLRGGGPLTTLVLPGAEKDEPVSLWRLLWANVPYRRAPVPDERVFPWLAPTRGADKFPATIPEDHADKLQAFWGMPRRIRLNLAANPDGIPCDLTGAVDAVIVIGWRQRPNGVRYVGWDHPLTPVYKDTKTNGWLPLHPQPGGIGYRHWLGLTLDDGDGKTRKRAECVGTWLGARIANIPKSARERTRLLAAGYDMDNMKARAFVESEMPLPGGRDPASEAAVRRRATDFIAAAEEAAGALRRAIRDARYNPDTALDAGPIATAFESFWSDTHDAFFAQLHEAAETPDTEETQQAAAQQWRGLLRRVVLRLFDEAAPLDPSAVSFKPERIVRERRKLVWMFDGFGPAGDRLFTALGLPLPEQAKSKAARRGKIQETV